MEKQINKPMTQQERIKAEAKIYCKDQALGSREDCSYCIPDYIAGATAEHERAQVLVDALEAVKRLKELWLYTGKVSPEHEGEAQALSAMALQIETTLQQWKGEKEVETVPPPQAPTYGVCMECNSRPATTDYNGQGCYVCQSCDDSLNSQFDNEYK